MLPRAEGPGAGEGPPQMSAPAGGAVPVRGGTDDCGMWLDKLGR